MKILNTAVVLASLFGWGKVFCAMTPSGDTTQAIVITVYQGDFNRTKETMQKLGARYETFLAQFVTSFFCTENAFGADVEDGCKRLHAAELSNVREQMWSKSYVFSRADFVQEKGMGVYNFSKRTPMGHGLTCEFTLQITADLKAQTILHYEFLDKCN